MQTLNEYMEFDRVVRSNGDGTFTDAPHMYAPELDGEEILSTIPWQYVNGFSGQYGYSGPVMHPSEYIGGGIERHITENPGLYVAVAIYPTLEEQLAVLEEDEELGNAEPYGWAVLFLDPDDETHV